ncbi:bifunctional DNA primase/polymerase [Aliiroseovarius sp. 2305UL8-7]|uniref:bifunctional DNA primase/polymerase n=1 Tax=Aliiroseovarius conchicola TaxID=3121637 RepID=UPI003529759C
MRSLILLWKWCPHTDSNRGPTDYKSTLNLPISNACKSEAVKPAFVDQYLSRNLSNLSLGDAALYYASLGWPVFPCIPNEKRPLTTNGFKAATTDPATINSWWEKSPNANIGLALDAAGLVAFDPDLYKPDCEWETFIRDRQLPETLTQSTASGGKHFIFSADEGVKYPGQLCKHVDIKHAGYIILAPSIFNDRPYAWENNRAPATAPQWFEQQSPPATPQSTEKPPTSEIAELLQHVSPDLPYDEWSKILMAVHDGTGGSDDGFTLVDQWSSAGTKYKGASDIQSHWNSFQNGGVTIRTLADAARASGADLAAISNRHKYDPAKIFANHPLPSTPVPLPAPPSVALNIFSADAFEGQEIKPRQWLVHNLIPLNDITIFSGDGGTGKSLVTLQLAASVARTGFWLNQITFGNSALYITAEDTTDEVHRRLEDIRRASSASFADYRNLHLLSLAGEDAILAAAVHSGGPLVATPAFKALEDAILRLRPSLLVLDNSSDLYGGDDNDKHQPRQFIQMLRGLCFRHSVTIVLLRHPSKSGMFTGDGTSGNTSWRNSVRGYLYLERVTDENGNEFDADERLITTKKSNYGPSSDKITVRYNDGVFVPKNPLAERINGDEDDALFMKILTQFQNEGRFVSSYENPKNYAPTLFARHPLNQGVPKQRFEQAMQRCLMAEKLHHVETGPPSKRRNHLVTSEVGA